MTGLLEEFIRALRARGVNVGVSEAIDANLALTILDLDVETLREGLAACLVKRHEDRRIFDEVFDMFFGKIAEEVQKTSDVAKDGERLTFEDAVRGVLEGDSTLIGEALVHLALMGSGEAPTVGSALQQTANVLRAVAALESRTFEEFDRRLNAINEGLEFAKSKILQELGPEEYTSVMEALENFEERDFLNMRFDEYLGDISFFLENVMRVERILRRLSRVLATRLIRREKIAKRGRIDLRKTIRKSVEHGGVLIEPAFKARRVEKPDLFVLCDVSGSMAWISEFFLILTVGIKRALRNVRCYLFTDKVFDVSEKLDVNLMESLFEQVSSLWDLVGGSHSNMETAFKEFLERTRGYRSKKSIVMILSDCRDHLGTWTEEGPISSKYIEQMARECKDVIILNPEDPSRWNTGDSAVIYYQAAGAKCFHVSNLRDLYEFVYWAISRRIRAC